MRRAILCAALCGAFLPATLLAQGFDYVIVEYPGAAITGLRGINNRGDAVGYYKVSADPADLSDVHALLIADGLLHTIGVPGSAGDNRAFGINDARLVAGSTQLLGLRGFTWDGARFEIVDFPGSTGTTIRGVNAAGDLAGEYDDAAGVRRGFVRIGGVFRSVDVPGAVSTRARDLSDSRWVSGYFVDPTGTQHPFVLALGEFLVPPFACAPGDSARAAGINGRRQVVGACFPAAGPPSAFVYDLVRGTAVPVAFPGATATLPLGINNRGQVVGEFVDALGRTRGFIATPRR